MADNNQWLDEFLSSPGPGFTRRPSFEKRCGIFYVLYKSDKRGSGNRDRLTQATIARAFGITQGAASRLAKALEPGHGGPNKFKKIADEWNRLGEEEFGRKYFTDEMREQLTAARREKSPSGPNPASNSHKGYHCLFDRDIVFVYWANEPKKGWSYTTCHGLYEDGAINHEFYEYIRERTSRAALMRAYGGRGAPAEIPPAITKAEAIARLSKNIP